MQMGGPGAVGRAPGTGGGSVGMKPSKHPPEGLDPARLKIALVAPRNMRFAPHAATSIDLHIHETARWSAYRRTMTVFAEEIADPFADVRVRFWPKGQPKGNLERLIAEEAPDLIVAHQHLPTAGRLAKRFAGTPVVLVRHNFQRPPRHLLSSFVKRRLFARLAGIAFVSERCRDQFEADWPNVATPRFVTPNGVDTGLWLPAFAKEQILLYVGRMAPEKGLLEAAEGIAKVVAGRPGWRAHFIVADAPGNEEYRAAVMRAIRSMGPDAELTFNAPHGEVRRMMARAPIVVAPTQGEESFGRVAVEAMSAGAAVVVSRASGFVEVVGDAGILLDRPDAGHVAEAVRRLVDDPEERVRLGRAARARAETKWDLSCAAQAFDRMATTLLAGAAVAPPVDLAATFE